MNAKLPSILWSPSLKREMKAGDPAALRILGVHDVPANRVSCFIARIDGNKKEVWVDIPGSYRRLVTCVDTLNCEWREAQLPAPAPDVSEFIIDPASDVHLVIRDKHGAILAGVVCVSDSPEARAALSHVHESFLATQNIVDALTDDNLTVTVRFNNAKAAEAFYDFVHHS